LEFARKAFEEFETVLEKAPNNTVALASVASLYYHQKKFDDAEIWYRKVIEADPQNKDAYYTLGVISWARTFPTRQQARSQLGMKPEDPGPIRDAKVRSELATANLPVVEAGIQNLEQALNIDKEYDDAMAYMNLLYREKADLEDNQQAYQQNIEVAENWVQKSLETKKLKAARIAQQEATGITN
jgi:Tfp pilus assembly protein PilF